MSIFRRTDQATDSGDTGSDVREDTHDRTDDRTDTRDEVAGETAGDARTDVDPDARHDEHGRHGQHDGLGDSGDRGDRDEVGRDGAALRDDEPARHSADPDPRGAAAPRDGGGPVATAGAGTAGAGSADTGHAATAGSGSAGTAHAATAGAGSAGAGHAAAGSDGTASGGSAAHDATAAGGQGEPERLVPRDRADAFMARWVDVKSEFVDEPRAAVGKADALVGELLDELQEVFTRQRRELEQGLDADDTSTEDLRLALRRYRSFFDRLVSF